MITVLPQNYEDVYVGGPVPSRSQHFDKSAFLFFIWIRDYMASTVEGVQAVSLLRPESLYN